MKQLKEYIKEGLFDDLDKIEKIGGMESNVKQLKKEIIDWIKENYECTGFKISDNPNKDGLYEVTAHKVNVKNRDITSLTNGKFEWKEADGFYCSFCTSLKSLEGAPQKVEGNFDCCTCKNLSSLEGAPKEVGGEFFCYDCTSLKTLEGAPKKVGRDFNCSSCPSLTSLKGAPQEVGRYFDCSACINLKSLEGAPKEVGGYFDCYRCINLKSLEGAPKKVGGEFHCYKCKINFTVDDVKKVSDVKGKIYVK